VSDPSVTVAVRAGTSDNGRVPSWGSFSYAFGPLVAVGGLVMLVLVLRWAFSRGHSVVATPGRSGAPEDYGLLVPVAEPRSRPEAQQTIDLLRQAGITSSVVQTTVGLRVMVWPAEAGRAEAILGTRPNDAAQA